MTIHIFLCPKCNSTEYDADLINTVEEAKQYPEEQADYLYSVQTCRYYDCTCLKCGEKWNDYECDTVYQTQ